MVQLSLNLKRVNLLRIEKVNLNQLVQGLAGYILCIDLYELAKLL